MEQLNPIAISNRTESFYPRWNSCSFLGINCYEQISSQFEEYLSDALIPENSCLLNEVCYPLQNIDTFYRCPWTKAEYDEDFLAKEANKVDEHISAICINAFPFDEIEKNFVNDISPKTDKSSGSINFEEENLHIVREKINDYKDFQCLEVPFISNSILKLKVNDIFFQDLLKNLSLMELDDVIGKERSVSLKDLEEYINIPLTPENEDFFPKAYEDFKELVLPEITFDDIEFGKSSNMLQCKSINLNQSIQESNLEKSYPSKRKFTENVDSSLSSSLLQHRNIDLSQSILEPNLKESYSPFERKFKMYLDNTSNIHFTSKIDDFSEQDVDTYNFEDDRNINCPLFDSVNEKDIPTRSLLLDVNAETVISKPKLLTYSSQSQLSDSDTRESQSGSTNGHTETYASCITIQNRTGSTINCKELTDDHFEPHRVLTLQDYTGSSSDNFESTNQPTKINGASSFNIKSDCSNVSLDLKKQVLIDNCNSGILEDDFVNMDENYFPEIYSDTHFDNCNENQNMNVENIVTSNTVMENSKFCHNSEMNLQKNYISKSKNSSTLFGKLSDLQLNRSVETSHISLLGYKNEKNETNLDKGVKYSAHRGDISSSHKTANDQNKIKIEDRMPNLCKIPNSEPFNLLTSWLLKQKGECAGREYFNSPTSFYQYQECSSDHRSGDLHLKQTLENNALNQKETYLSSAFEKEDKLQLFSTEDIVIAFPEHYLELAVMHETVALYFVQKLFCWEGFQFSLDLTLLDISLDRMRFLLNQELKSCRDRNLSPLQGGIKYSNYVQLLILHGILKSLNCFIHFGTELCLSTLLDFTKKHSGFPKDCFEDLITKVKNFVQKFPTTESVHPKIKGLCTYLQDKYYFYKENSIPFKSRQLFKICSNLYQPLLSSENLLPDINKILLPKSWCSLKLQNKVLIIMKQHFNFFFSTFEAFMKTLLPEITVALILESSLLQQDSATFRDDKDHIYIAWSSSLSNDISWRNVTVVIEYETDNSTCWKSVCVEQNVAHARIKLEQLQFKTLNEIKNMPISKDHFSANNRKLQKVIFIAAASICSEYDLKTIVDSMQNAVLYERSYKMYLPHMHFADIVVNPESGLVVVELISFFNDGFLEQLVDRITSLHKKLEICWIIIEDNLSTMNLDKACLNKIKQSFCTFYLAMKMKNNHSFKLKFLHAKTNEEVSKWINCVLSKSYKRVSNDFNSYPVPSLPLDMKQEELFLLSFSSLNPINASFILSSGCSLQDVMNLKLDDLCSRYSYIPERFLKDFHSLIHEKMYNSQNPNEAIQDEILDPPRNPFSIPHSSKDNPFDEPLDSDSDDHTNSFEKLHFGIGNYDTNKAIKSRCSFKDFDILAENYNIDIVQYNKATKPSSFKELDNEVENYDTDIIQTYNATKIGHCFKDLDIGAENYNINVVDTKDATKLNHSFNEFVTGTKNYDTNIGHANKASKSSCSFDNNSPISKSWSPDDYSKMSLEDIDKTYRELQLESNVCSLNDTDSSVNMYSGNFGSTSAECQFALHLPEEKMDEDEMDVDLIVSQNTPDSAIQEIQPYILDKQPPHPRSNKIKHKVTFSCDDDYSSPQQKDKSSKESQSVSEYLSQFVYKKKRKSPDNSKQPKFVKYSQDSFLSKSFRVRKGLSSKTVCKQTLLQKALLSQEFLPMQEPIYSPKSTMSQNSIPKFELNCFKTVRSDDTPNEYSEGLDLPYVSQGKVALTPKQGHRLSYEKIPGSKGQTRLVFH